MDASLIAVDIGNSRIKFGLFDTEDTARGTADLPQPASTLELSPEPWDPAPIDAWLKKAGEPRARWLLGSVNRKTCARLVGWIEQHDTAANIAELHVADLPLVVALDEPERVGIDRLLAAVAVNRLRSQRRPAVVIDLGSAITVDLVTAEGAFAGGAILPGIGMSARALHEQTDLLPHLYKKGLGAAPPALGVSTVAAIESGLYWGAVGAMRELVHQLSQDQSRKPEIFLTGGAAPAVAERFGPDAQYVPHLVLAGIALVRPATISNV
ncbi:MAG: type III pantothenate kinase [Pirellulales bacterium]